MAKERLSQLVSQSGWLLHCLPPLRQVILTACAGRAATTLLRRAFPTLMPHYILAVRPVTSCDVQAVVI